MPEKISLKLTEEQKAAIKAATGTVFPTLASASVRGSKIASTRRAPDAAAPPP